MEKSGTRKPLIAVLVVAVSLAVLVGAFFGIRAIYNAMNPIESKEAISSHMSDALDDLTPAPDYGSMSALSSAFSSAAGVECFGGGLSAGNGVMQQICENDEYADTPGMEGTGKVYYLYWSKNGDSSEAFSQVKPPANLTYKVAGNGWALVTNDSDAAADAESQMGGTRLY